MARALETAKRCQGLAPTEGAADGRTRDGAGAEGTGGLLVVTGVGGTIHQRSAVSRQSCVMPVTNADTCPKCAARGKHSDKDAEQACTGATGKPSRGLVEGTRQAKPTQRSRRGRTRPTRTVSPTHYILY